MSMSRVSPEEVRRSFSYDADSGNLHWKEKPRSRLRVGDKAGYINGHGYVVVSFRNTKFQAHHLVWLIFNESLPSSDIDHVNGVRHDNRIENLRAATRSENLQNRKVAGSRSKSGILGVHWCERDRRWIANIKADGKRIRVGAYRCKSEAQEAYLAAKRRLHPFAFALAVDDR